MNRFRRFKRVAFWFEAGLSAIAIFLVTGSVIWASLATLVMDGPAALVRLVIETARYFGKPALDFFLEFPLMVALFVLVASGYAYSMLYLAQTTTEKRLCKYVIPPAIVCIPVCIFAVFFMMFAVFVRSP